MFAVASKSERISHAEVFVNTQFERVTVAARMRVAHGSLDIDQGLVNIKDCFPVSDYYYYFIKIKIQFLL